MDLKSSTPLSLLCAHDGMKVMRCNRRRYPIFCRIMNTRPPTATKTVYPILNQIVNLKLTFSRGRNSL